MMDGRDNPWGARKGMLGEQAMRTELDP